MREPLCGRTAPTGEPPLVKQSCAPVDRWRLRRLCSWMPLWDPSLLLTMPVLVGVLLGLTAPNVLAAPDIVKADQANTIRRWSQHQEAVNRPRRIVLQYDASGLLGCDWAQWSARVMKYTDEPGNQVDSIWWDLGGGNRATYPSQVLPLSPDPGLKKWWDQGIDWVGELVKECRKRNLEVFWNYRVNDVDYSGSKENAAKKEHPDWVLQSWKWGTRDADLWNYAVPGVREHHLAILRELAENYDWDGIQLDFAATCLAFRSAGNGNCARA